MYRAIFQDALYAFPTLEVEFERDLIRLLAIVERRGIRVYLEDLPAIGKHLDRCLSNGEYNPPGLPLTKRKSSGVVIPRFLGGLYLLIFDDCGRLREDCSIEAVFFLRQILFAAKKARFDCSRRKVKDAVLEFVATDGELPEPEGFWDVLGSDTPTVEETYLGFGKSDPLKDRLAAIEDPRRRLELSLFLAKLDTVSGIVTTTLGAYHPSDWRFRHGPGAIAEKTGPTNKYSWTNWSDSLESEYPIADYGFHNFSSWASRCEESSTIHSHERSSRLIAVPKSFAGPRLIAAEPSEHQWCQQNLRHYFMSRAGDTWLLGFVNFRDQSRNQELCSRGSREGTIATVDLSAASDRVTCHAVGQFFRRNPGLLRALRASRTRSVTQDLVQSAPGVVSLRKFSTMGSACTFPVETLMFLGIALAAVLQARRLAPTPRNVKALMGEVAVFGDDIVIPVDSRELFVDALELLWFKVNTNKSFWTGKFRESCGVDAFDGVTVTPVYWSRVYDGGPESLASTVEVSNNYYQKWLLNTAAYLASTLPADVPRVAQRSGVFGLKTRFRPRNTTFRRRYNHDLQRVELFVRSLKAKQERAPTNDDTALLQFFTEDPGPGNPWAHGVPQRPTLKTKCRWVSCGDITAQ